MLRGRGQSPFLASQRSPENAMIEPTEFFELIPPQLVMGAGTMLVVVSIVALFLA